ncbi:MAG TPA: zf-HC2 domain-containing protein [Abditibacteriaceae bacterium]|jgi:anti-sigma factor RsiW
MKKLSNEDLMDYLDGTLDPARLAKVEAHLAANADDAVLVADMKMAMGALNEWNEAEPVKVSPDFWVKVREQLPEHPTRSPLRALGAQLGAWLWPAHSPLRLSTRVAALAVFVAMAAALMSPKGAVHQVQADLSDADKMFIQQSVDRHSAYVAVQPLNSTLNLPVGDGRDGDGDGEDGEGEDESYTP